MKKPVLLFLFVAAAAAADYHLLKKIPVSGDGTWDYLYLDQAARRLYVSHRTRVEVIDVDADKPVGKITGMQGVHGIAIAAKLHRGFITSGNTSTVKMFDLKTLESLADIRAGIGPDGVLFEPVTGRVFAFNHRGGTLTVIDAKAGKAIENIELGGQPEFPVTDGEGMVW
jgi:DNA-binding beta-propeller fold protein YncE